MSSVDEILGEIKDYFETTDVPAVFARAAGNPDYLRTNWEKYRTVMRPGEIDSGTKELMGLGVAIAESSEYLVAFQKRRLPTCNLSDRDQLEALAVADFFEGFDAFAHALHVDSEIRPRRLLSGDLSLLDKEVDVNVSYLVETDDPVVREVYEEIKSTMRIPFVPNIFKALAHQPAMLRAKWDSYRAIMVGGQLSRLTKELIAVAVSAVNACFY